MVESEFLSIQLEKGICTDDIYSIISLVAGDPSLNNDRPNSKSKPKQSGFKTLRAVFSNRRNKNIKQINYTYVSEAGTGEAEVDTGGMDVRDVLEEPCMGSFRPSMPITDEGEVAVWPFERGMEAFRVGVGKEAAGTSVVRIIN